ncbi:efflux RND transporter periplasmic adaptor subunit [Edaphobacter albus]|uniref:efflux RND transporter periplasmic adaptor subunit n=1 Tax=Edaphobacter sp. 4G125 TaxID=2763071 RepID=UPI001644F4C8|nr:efflux RND transporter periplasmic adaptor subunit [Edaphobacter sp. 4G125]QNI35354.1 efflux RND transporter periplasmic adaptor subunit [Edaphobacter sp. 4G125]
MPTTETRRLNPYALTGIILAVVLLAFLGIRMLTRDIVEVRAAAVTHQNLLKAISTNGRVEPIEEFQAHAQAPGVVSKIYVKVGQKVKKGELLLRMEDADVVSKLATAKSSLASAQSTAHDLAQGGTQEERLALAADLSRAEHQKQQADKDLAALRQLQQRGAASASEVASAEQRVQAAQITLNSVQQRETQRYGASDRSKVQAQLADAQATVAAARSSYNNANIRSPLAGTVYSIPVTTYDYVDGGETLMDVADLNRLQVRAYFDEPEIGKLAVGQAVKIVWDAKPDQAWHGHISRAPSTVIAYGTRNVGECIITVDDAREDLLPNTNVTVTVTVSQRFNVLSVPREALHTEGVSDYVYRIVQGKLVRTPVQVGVLNLTRVEILSGLTEKDTVALNATSSNRDLSNGLAVKIVE